MRIDMITERMASVSFFSRDIAAAAWSETPSQENRALSAIDSAMTSSPMIS